MPDRRRTVWLVEVAIATAGLISVAGPSGLRVVAALFLVFLAPGVQMMRWLGLRVSLNGQTLVLSIGLSLAISPVIVYWGSLIQGFQPGTVAGALVGVALLLGLIARIWPVRQEVLLGPLFAQRRVSWLFLGLILVLAGMIGLPYLQFEFNGTLFEPIMNDWPKHYTVVWLVEETGIPPRNLLYLPWQDRPFVYYYFFHISVATLRLLSGGGLSILAAFVVATVLVALALLGLMAMLVRRMVGEERPTLLSLLFASLVGGLDVVPLVARGVDNVLRSGFSVEGFIVSMGVDGWTSVRESVISTLYTSYLWTPQHVMGGLILVLGLVLFGVLGRSRRLGTLLPLLLFSLIGHSVYVAVPVFVALGLFVLGDVFGQARTSSARFPIVRRIAVWGAIAAGFLVVSAPYLRDLLSTTSAESSGLVFHVAPNGGDWLDGALFRQFLGDHWWTRLLDAPLYYLLELGALLLFGIYGWGVIYQRRKKAGSKPATVDTLDDHPLSFRPEAVRLLVLTAVVAFVLTLVLMSEGALSGLTFNDFRKKAVLPLEIGLACFSGAALAHMLAQWRKPLALLMLSTVLLGMLAVGWDFAGRSFARFVLNRGVPADAMAAYDFVRTHTPENAVFQGDPGAFLYRDRPLHLYGQRISRLDTGMLPLLHVPPGEFEQDLRAFGRAITSESPRESWSLLRQLQIDYVFIGPEEREIYQAYTGLRQLDDGTYFQTVYQGDGYRIIRVLPE